MQIGAEVFAAVCAVLAIAGAAYYALCAWVGLRFVRERPKEVSFAPPVTIMKSLKGMDPHMRAAFRSHCLLDYPEFEVLFGVADLNDPAVAVVNEVQQEFPHARLRVVTDAKHCLPTERPALSANLVRSFIRADQSRERIATINGICGKMMAGTSNQPTATDELKISLWYPARTLRIAFDIIVR